jgi:glucosylceramidase
MAKVMAEDLGLTHPESWSAWVGINNYGVNEEGQRISDGLLVADDEFTELYTAARYYAVAHFSKYIPAGSVGIYSNHSRFLGKDIDLGDVQTCAFITPEGKTVLVVVNSGDNFNIATNKFFCDMEVITSTADEQLKTVYSGNSKLFVEVPANSITTIIYE